MEFVELEADVAALQALEGDEEAEVALNSCQITIISVSPS